MSVSMANISSKTNKKAKHTDVDQLLRPAYELAYTSRCLDEKMLIMIRQGKSFFHIGCMGHEAVQVACGLAMKSGHDYLFPYYRDQALCLTLGQTAQDCLLAFLAKAADPHAGGRQMPMHYGNHRLNIPSSSSSTGTQFLQAVGAALASKKLFEDKIEKEMAVTVCTTGDGTTSQGEFYEAISWAAKDQAPIIFLVENNRYAISVEINEQRPGGRIAENFAGFAGLRVLKIDGCDFLSSYAYLKNAIESVRKGDGPILIDADVVRLLPHSSSDDDKKYRTPEDLAMDRKRDPIGLLRESLLKQKVITEDQLVKLEAKIKASVEQASIRAENASEPEAQSATDFVWSKHCPLKKKPTPLSELTWESEPTVMVDAINRALKEELKANPKMLVFGQDVAKGKGGVFTATRGLTELYGDRCFNAPLAEASIVGVAIGYALRGFRPVPEIQFGDYIWTAMMQIRNELSTMRYRSNNTCNAPVVIRVPVGGYIHGGLCHSQNIEATFSHFPGLKIALPSTALDAYGLLKEAMAGDDPVLFLEHKALYRQSFARSNLPNESTFRQVFGEGIVRREGSSVTVVTYGILVQRALEAANLVQDLGISVEVIDLRTIVPYDRELIYKSLNTTGRVLVLHEDMRFMGFGAEIASDIGEFAFSALDAPVMRLAAKDTPVPYSSTLEAEILPQTSEIVAKIKELAQF
jgi:2-oxoisovalerate dehydrogenase E1 component